MEKKCFIAGLPGAGKTTFLAALMNLISYRDSGSKFSLNIVDDLQHLMNLSERWSNAEPLDRTKQSDEHMNLSINLKLPDESILDLFLPDMSGETFQKIYETRQVSEEIKDYVYSADTLLFFINVKEIKQLNLISQVYNGQSNFSNNEEDSIERNPRLHDQFQTQVIELLQFFTIMREKRKIKIGFMFSAWDIIIDQKYNYTPEEFMKNKMSMLWQYCNANKDIIEYVSWGISAQGGELIDKEKLLKHQFPYQRIYIQGNDKIINNDLTIPLFLLMGDKDE